MFVCLIGRECGGSALITKLPVARWEVKWHRGKEDFYFCSKGAAVAFYFFIHVLFVCCMMRFCRLSLLLASCCVLMVSISGMLQPPAAAVVVHDPTAMAQGKERGTAIAKHAARIGHVHAKCFFPNVAMCYHSEAIMLEDSGAYLHAANSYVMAARLYAKKADHDVPIAKLIREQLLRDIANFSVIDVDGGLFMMNLIAEYADIDRDEEDTLAHLAAAHCFYAAARAYAVAPSRDLAAKAISAAAKHCDVSLQSALARDDHKTAAQIYSLSADVHRILGKRGIARRMQAAEPQQHAAYAAYLAARGDRSNAATSYRTAARAFESLKEHEKARLMWQASAEQFQASGVELVAQGHPGRALASYFNAVDAYEAMAGLGGESL